MQNFCDLDLGRFKVIQGQKSWSTSCFTCIDPNIVSVTIFEIFDM